MKEELLKEIVEKLSDLEVGESLRIEITKYKEDGSNSNANSGTLITSVINEENLEKRVSKILLKLGFNSNIKGYYYVKTAIMLGYEDESLLHNITKGLYIDVAKAYKTTMSRTERAIRHAIESTWNKGNQELMNEIFGDTISKKRGKPTNSEFIAQVVNAMRMDLI